MNKVFPFIYLFLNFYDTIMQYYILTFIHIHPHIIETFIFKDPILVIKFYMALK